MIDLNILSNKLLKKYNDFRFLGKGQHGFALLNKNNKVYKFTTSKNEIEIVKKLINNDFKTFPKIYLIKEFKNIYLYIRDYYNEIPENLGELIDENMDEIADFVEERKNFDSKKSNTNLTYEFDDNFLEFLSKLKKDLFHLGLLPFKWD